MNKEIVIPDDMEKIHVDGGAIASNNDNVRLILYAEEINKGTIIKDEVEVENVGKIELIMSKTIASKIQNIIQNELEKN